MAGEPKDYRLMSAREALNKSPGHDKCRVLSLSIATELSQELQLVEVAATISRAQAHLSSKLPGASNPD